MKQPLWIINGQEKIVSEKHKEQLRESTKTVEQEVHWLKQLKVLVAKYSQPKLVLAGYQF